MKRLLLFVVIGLIVAVVGINWYYTSQIRAQLDRMASAASMFGTLSYDSVRLTPGGAININELSFRVRQARGGVEVDRISLQTANLLALLTLEGDLERGRPPETLGLRIDSIQFPLYGKLASMTRQTPGTTSPASAAGVAFAAAGCDDRTQFTANDLMQMDYFDIRADVEAQYRLIDNGSRLRLFASVRTDDASAIHFQATFDLPSGSLSTQDLTRSMQNARLGSFSLEYENLGFYERMLAFCAEEMSMSESDYIAHHVTAWKRAWSGLGAEPGPDVVAAYESFLKEPRQLSVRSGAESSISIDGIENYTMAGLLERMKVGLVVNYGDPQPLDMTALDQSQPRIVTSEQPTGADSVAASPEPANQPRAANAGGSDANATQGAAASSGSRWIQVDPGKIEAHLDQRLRIRMQSGDRYSGRLSRVDSDNIHIRVQGVGGYYIRPLALGEIRELEVYERP